jgi:ubiquinone/menaquinone biosynthesis C-methylase UbiE
MLQNSFTRHDVLEIACGTGYWTERISLVARSILALDQSIELLAIARKKALQNAYYQHEDAYLLSKIRGEFSASFSGFWWSHIPKPKIQYFLHQLHRKLTPGATIIFIDNNFVAGSNHAIAQTDADGNTYQTRHLPDGSSHKILKNFPTDQELKQSMPEGIENIRIERLKYFWLMRYTLAHSFSILGEQQA